MTTDTNKTLVHRIYEELINQENKAVIDEAFAPDVMVHDPFSGTAQGIETFAQLLSMFDAAFPGHRVTVEEVIAEGDMVAVLHTHYATHHGPFMGLPPTGRQLVVNGLELFRIQKGRIVEFWRKDDDVSLLAQLGLMPLPARSEV